MRSTWASPPAARPRSTAIPYRVCRLIHVCLTWGIETVGSGGNLEIAPLVSADGPGLGLSGLPEAVPAPAPGTSLAAAAAVGATVRPEPGRLLLLFTAGGPDGSDGWDARAGERDRDGGTVGGARIEPDVAALAFGHEPGRIGAETNAVGLAERGVFLEKDRTDGWLPLRRGCAPRDGLGRWRTGARSRFWPAVGRLDGIFEQIGAKGSDTTRHRPGRTTPSADSAATATVTSRDRARLASIPTTLRVTNSRSTRCKDGT